MKQESQPDRSVFRDHALTDLVEASLFDAGGNPKTPESEDTFDRLMQHLEARGLVAEGIGEDSSESRPPDGDTTTLTGEDEAYVRRVLDDAVNNGQIAPIMGLRYAEAFGIEPPESLLSLDPTESPTSDD
ncbi:MAG TPA: hypothetical protein VMB52_02575 [Verrucomicrobiae bacterium]|nr:hypothetical protein [Verrucomicrobiae bacterium]